METSTTVTVAIIEHESSARTALHRLLTDIGFPDILITEKVDHSSLSDPFLPYPLIFVGCKIWEQMKCSVISTLRKDQTRQGRKVLLFVPFDHPIDLLEAIRLGIDGYITYPFSRNNIRQKLHTILPQVAFESQKAPPQKRRNSRAQKKPSVSKR